MMSTQGDSQPPTSLVSPDPGDDAGAEPSEVDAWLDSEPPWAGLIGMFPNGGVKVEEFDEWLDAARSSDERLARKGGDRW